MARIVIAGAGAIGASIAYHLAQLGARDVVLCDRAEIASGATGKAMGGFRQQFSTEAEVRLARASQELFAELGPPLFEQVGYMFVATTEEGLARLTERAQLQQSLGVPVEQVDASRVAGLCVDDVLVIACGAASPELRPALPVRPLCRQLVDVGPVEGLPHDLPMTIEEETGFHFRRRSDTLRLAMPEPTPRWTAEAYVDDVLVEDKRRRLAHRYPLSAGAPVMRAWAGLYDMTPDAHPIVGPVADGVYVAAGFSGHGFMQSPAVGRAVAEELLHGESDLDLSPYRVERFAGEAVFPETLVL